MSLAAADRHYLTDRLLDDPILFETQLNFEVEARDLHDTVVQRGSKAVVSSDHS